MRLLIDTDAFCKFGAGGLLEDVAEVLGVAWPECFRLPALQQMLQRGSLPKRLGADLCRMLLPIAKRLDKVPPAPATWFSRLSGLPAVDPGEAQLLAHVAASGDLLLTGDKRALRTVKDIEGFAAVLRGRVVLPEAALLALCILRGDNQIRAAMTRVLPLDTVVRTCFSTGNAAPRDGLQSYLRAATVDLAPLVLWTPT